MKVAVYMRVSSEEQREKETIKNQRETLEAWLAKEGYTVVEWYADDGVSGDVPFAKREAGARLIADARTGKFRKVVAYSVSRLGRRVEDILQTIKLLHEELGLDFRSKSEDFPVTGAFGKLVITILAAISELEKATIIERTRLGSIRIAREGRLPCGKARYGYRRCENGFPEVNAEEAAVVVLIFDLCLRGLGASRIAAYLNARGVPSPKPAGTGSKNGASRGVWTPGVVRAILHDTIYVGAYVWRKRRIERKVTGEGVERRVVKAAVEDHILIPTPELISIDTFSAAQARIATNQTFSPGNSKRFYLLRGLVKCGVCEFGYSGRSCSTGGRNNRPAKYCCHNEGARPCNSPGVRAEWLEEEVRQQIRAFVLNPGEVSEQLRAQVEALEVEPVDTAAQLAEIEATIAEKVAAKKRTTSLVVKGVIDEEDAKEALDELRVELAELEEARERIMADAHAAVNLSNAVAEVEGLLADLKEGLDNLDDEGWREVVELLVESVTVTPKGFRGNRGIPRAIARFKFTPDVAGVDLLRKAGVREHRRLNSWQLKPGLTLTRELRLPLPRTGAYPMRPL